MKNWSGCSNSLIRSLSIFLGLFFVVTTHGVAQNFENPSLSQSLNAPLTPQSTFYNNAQFNVADTTIAGEVYPDPKSVLYKSLLIPGWGQIVNKQVWKVPIIYGLLAGLAGYSIYLTKKYHDYRAAYYNQNPDIPDNDMRFGSTPAYLEGANLSSLQSNRNFFHNRRDFIYITIVLAYGLNAIDAYIFAHLRSFDVSEDLSMRATMKPQILAHSSPGLTLSFELFNSNK